MEQDKLLKVDKTIEKLCDFLQKETARVASIYESQELTEMTKALAELMSARAKFDQFSFSLFRITRHGSACMNSIGESRRKDNMQWKSKELKGYGAEMLSTECN